MNLTDSIIRARYRKSREKAELLTAEEVAEFTIVFYPISNLFKKSHLIRLDVSSSNYPRFDLNPNTGESLGQNTRTRIAENTVYCGPSHPSHMVLPIIP
jgi:putative CocE/NonD family hydrolase